MEPTLRRHKRLRALADAERHDHPETLFAYELRGAGKAPAGPAEESSGRLETHSCRLGRAQVLGRLSRGLRGGALQMQYRGGTLVYRAGEPEVVPQFAGGAHTRRYPAPV